MFIPLTGWGRLGPSESLWGPTIAMDKKRVRTYSGSDRDAQMLQTVADYHGFSKSGTITNLIRKEFWRVFPKGTGNIKPDPHAHVRE